MYNEAGRKPLECRYILLPSIISNDILMFPIASSTALITSTASDIGVGLLAVLGIVLAAWAGLVALGYFTRKTTKKVTGHKY